MGYSFQPAVIDEDFQVAVNSRLVEGIHLFASAGKHLIHPQRPFVLSEDFLYSHSL